MADDIKRLRVDISKRMEGALDTLKRDFAGLRSGRATAALLEPIRVEAYGSVTLLTQVASIAAPEPRMLTVQVWDGSLVGSIEKSIRESGLGLNPSLDGQTIRVPIPQLTEERRNELARAAGRYAELARRAVRGVRRDGMDQIKAQVKNGDISEDFAKDWAKEIQKITDNFIRTVDDMLTDKERDIKQI